MTWEGRCNNHPELSNPAFPPRVPSLESSDNLTNIFTATLVSHFPSYGSEYSIVMCIVFVQDEGLCFNSPWVSLSLHVIALGSIKANPPHRNNQWKGTELPIMLLLFRDNTLTFFCVFNISSWCYAGPRKEDRGRIWVALWTELFGPLLVDQLAAWHAERFWAEQEVLPHRHSVLSHSLWRKTWSKWPAGQVKRALLLKMII